MKPHKHAKLIKAWADGADIQTKNRLGNPDYEPDWLDDLNPYWGSDILDFRIKPEQKPDVVEYYQLLRGDNEAQRVRKEYANLEIIWDGETGELKSAKVLK